MSTMKTRPRPDLGRYVYLKPVLLEGRTAYAVCDAEGTCLWLETDRESASKTLHAHDVVALSLH